MEKKQYPPCIEVCNIGTLVLKQLPQVPWEIQISFLVVVLFCFSVYTLWLRVRVTISSLLKPKSITRDSIMKYSNPD